MSNAYRHFKTQQDVDEDFRGHIEEDKHSGCWNWKPKNFRFRHGMFTFNPRRYAAQMMGYVIPQGRNIGPRCANERCVNPDHSMLLHDTKPLPKDNLLYLEVRDFDYPRTYLALKYHKSQKTVIDARTNTLRLIQAIKQGYLSNERWANQYCVAPSYIKTLREITLQEFNEMKVDKNENVIDRSEVNPEGLKFQL